VRTIERSLVNISDYGAQVGSAQVVPQTTVSLVPQTTVSFVPQTTVVPLTSNKLPSEGETGQSAPPQDDPHTTFSEVPVPQTTLPQVTSKQRVAQGVHAPPDPTAAGDQITPHAMLLPAAVVGAPQSAPVDQALASGVG
jgi:hypothetical protein